MSSDPYPQFDSQVEEVTSPATVLASLMTPPPDSPMAVSEETEPFEEDEVAATPVISPAIPTPLRASDPETDNDSSDSEASNFFSLLPPPSQPAPAERRGSTTIYYTRRRVRTPTAPVQPPPAPPTSPISPTSPTSPTSPLQMISQSPPLSPRRPMPPPTVFYYQTTTVPSSSPTRPLRARSNPLPLSDGAHFSTPSLSDSHIENTAEYVWTRPFKRHETHSNEIAVLNNEMPLERL
jgi:hypothetical protein